MIILLVHSFTKWTNDESVKKIVGFVILNVVLTVIFVQRSKVEIFNCFNIQF